MTTLTTTRAVSLAAVIAFSAVGAANGQFYFVGHAPNTTASFVYGLSADGTIATGFSRDGLSSAEPGFIWASNGYRSDFGQLAGMGIITDSVGITGDGQAVAGTYYEDLNSSARPFTYSASAGLRVLGTVSGLRNSYGTGIGGDSTHPVVVGTASDRQFAIRTAWRWTEGNGMQNLGLVNANDFYSEASAVSRNGSTVVGFGGDGSVCRAFTWSEENGMHSLASLNGSTFQRAYAVNSIGTIVVGYSDVSSTVSHASMWRDGLPIDLGNPVGSSRATARAVSDDGRVVVGDAWGDAQGVGQYAFIWTAEEGSMSLDAYAALHSLLTPPGWHFTYASSLSADGKTIGGTGVFPDGTGGGFVLHVPAAPTLSLLGFAAMFLRRAR